MSAVRAAHEALWRAYHISVHITRYYALPMTLRCAALLIICRARVDDVDIDAHALFSYAARRLPL